MKTLLLDTHAVVWYLSDPGRLSETVLHRIHESVEDGSLLFVSVISLIELVYLVEKGRIPRFSLDEFKRELAAPDSPFEILPIDASLIDSLQRVPRESVPDMPDRIIAATALHRGLTLVTQDQLLQNSSVETIW